METLPSAYLLLSVRTDPFAPKHGSTQTNEDQYVREKRPVEIEVQKDKDLEQCRTNYMKAHTSGIPLMNLIKCYDTWADKYDGDMKAGRYNGPEILEKVIDQFYPTASRHAAKILDIAAGTGLAGEVLRKLGFKVIDAVEPSEGMVNVLRTKGIYNKVFQSAVGYEPIPEIVADTYDALVILGGMGEGHVPLRAMAEIIRIVRPGGMIFIVMKHENKTPIDEYRHKRLTAFLQMLAYKGLWWQVTSKVEKNYLFDEDGIVFCFEKTEI